jgi:hypothetical protein
MTYKPVKVHEFKKAKKTDKKKEKNAGNKFR